MFEFYFSAFLDHKLENDQDNLVVKGACSFISHCSHVLGKYFDFELKFLKSLLEFDLNSLTFDLNLNPLIICKSMEKIKNLMISLQINQRLFREIIIQLNEQNIRKQFELIIDDNERVINELTNTCRQHFSVNTNTNLKETVPFIDCEESPESDTNILEIIDSTNDLVNDSEECDDNSKKYRCQWPGCDYKTKFTANIDKHMCKHSDLRRYVCEWPNCHKQYKQSNALVTHKRSHLGLKPFACDFVGCHYRTNNRCSLPAHRKTHIGLKPFACDWPQCEVSCSTVTHLRDHQMSHRKEKPFKCDVCQQCFTKKSNMKSHKQSVHFGLKRVRNKNNFDVESNQLQTNL